MYSPCVSGFLVSDAACCPSGCNPNQKPCNNRSDYVFWDEVHPTEAWNLVNAISAYNSTIDPAFTYPMNITQLVDCVDCVLQPRFRHKIAVQIKVNFNA